MMASLIKTEIECLLNFLEPMLGLANSHMVDFFTKSCFQVYLPVEMQKEIAHLGSKKCTELILNDDLKSTNVLKHYIEMSQRFTLSNSNVCLSLNDLVEKIGLDIEKFKLEVFMNTKKSHEVEILSAVIASLCKSENVSHLIDIGDGKGYLSSMLALHYEIPTLGVDSSHVNTCSAGKRVVKLSRVWKGLGAAPKKSHPAASDSNESPNVHLYKQVTEFITERSDLEKLLVENFPLEKKPKVGLIGLHTCGGLAADSLKIFNANANIEILCNVGCCYHLLEEDNRTGFPLSAFLKERNVIIGRSARMIANQSVERILNENSLPNKTIYYRALLEVLFRKLRPKSDDKHVGRFRKECSNFHDYCKKAAGKVGVDFGLSDEEIKKFLISYEEQEDDLNLFYLIRGKLAPVIECLIMLDRLLYLKENNWERSFLTQFFDPVISPRCYGIVSIRKS